MNIPDCVRTLCCTAIAAGCVLAWSENGNRTGEWPTYGGNLKSQKYSPLDQVNAKNVHQLEIAWRWNSPDNEMVAQNRRLMPFFYEATPLFLNGTLYTTSSLGIIAAIDPVTGESKWTYDTKTYEYGRPTNLGFVQRGVSYWTDGEEERILLATGSAHLWSVDAKTGKPDPNFGDGGKVDLTKHARRPINRGVYAVTSPPLIFRDKAIVGASIFDGPIRKEMPPGDVRAFNVRTGELEWTFHNPPEEDEVGYDTWEGDSAEYTGNGNVWTLMSADPELGYVYLPFGTPTNDWYGGHRHGDGLFGETLVCVDGETGERIWHFQTAHHGVWDYDLCAAPVLMDITVDGKDINAVAQVTKQAFLFVLDRKTGEPVWPIEEREVPPSTAEGEKLSPTQPFPTKPKPFDRQGVTRNDLINFTTELKAEALKILEQYNYGELYTPPMEGKPTLYVPGWNGGGNWGGLGYDPESKQVFIPSIASPISVELTRPDPARSNFTMVGKLNTRVPGPEGLPLLKPPYGQITAIDMNSGEHEWQVVHGEGPTNHPLLKDMDLEPLGESDRGFPLVTKELLFMAQESGGKAGAEGDEGDKPNFRAFHKDTGQVLWEFSLPYAPTSAPMTYMVDGKQYIAVAVGGLMNPAELVAMALPDQQETD